MKHMGIGNVFRGMPPVTKNLIIVNFLLWLVEILIPNFGVTLINKLGLHYADSALFNPIQIITYMFMHDQGSVLHILFNMFTLWMFGRVLEQVWGSRRFFMFYMVCGIGAALVQEAVWAFTWKYEYVSEIARLNGLTYDHMLEVVNEAVAAGDGRFLSAIGQMKSQMVVIGASGAIFGLLLGFAMTFPDMPMYLFFIPVPIKAKYMVIGYAVLEFFLGIGGVGAVAHFAHLGGALFALFILLYWKKKGTLRGNGFY